LTLINPLELY